MKVLFDSKNNIIYNSELTKLRTLKKKNITKKFIL